ncbi:MAG: hypothetical protein E7470_00025 [Ruminococcaceae bacterium]|nr:hypothetical protein [Oscillospiraceae bacterium]
MVDFHSHILPGIDDGSTSREMSMEMLCMEARQGITHVVATPHFYAHEDKLERFLQRRDRAEQVLRSEMRNHTGLPELLIGAEVSFFRGISETAFLHELKIRGTDSVLIEMPAAPWDDAMFSELRAIWERQRLVPIIAHIDRYIGPWRTYNIPKRLSQLPVLVQANAEAFTDRHVEKLMLRLLKADAIHLLGSDCHNLAERTPNMADAVEHIRAKIGSDALARIHMHENRVLKIAP